MSGPQGFRLSPQQRRLFRLHAALPAACVVALEVERDGPFAPGELWDGLRVATARHEVLRTRLARVPGLELPLQVVTPDMRPVLEAARPGQPEPAVDPESGPVLHVAWWAPSAGVHRLRLTASGFAADVPGLARLLREALGSTPEEPSPEGPLQYADVSEWLNDWQRDDGGAAGRDFWRGQLASAPAFTPLPPEPGPRTAAPKGRVSRQLPDEVAARVVSLARASSLDPQDVLLAAWLGLVSRLAGTRDLRIGVAFDGRRLEELETAQGPLTRCLPVRLRLAGGAGLAELARAASRARQEVAEWQDDYPDERAGSGLPPVAFEWVDLDGRAAVPGARLVDATTWLEPAAGRLLVTRSGGRIRLTLHHDGMTAAAADRLLERLVVLLDADPAADLASVDLVGPEERRALLDLARGPRLETPRATVVSRVRDAAERDPASIAIVQGERRVSYGELCASALGIAASLLARGVTPGTRVGLLAERSPGSVAGILGALQARAAYVPLDPAYPATRLRQTLGDSGARLVLTTRDLVSSVPEDREPVLVDEGFEGPAAVAGPGPVPDDLAYVIYTSGSTGRPKGVAVAHASLAASTSAREAYYPAPVRRYLLLSSLAFDSSVAGLFWTLSQGGTLVLPAPGEERDPHALVARIESEAVTHLLALPALYAALLEEAEAGGGASSGAARRLASLETVIVAGEACSPALVARHRRLLPGAELHNEYGPTEGTVWSTVETFGGPDPAVVPIGRPIPGARVHVLDSDLRPVPLGATGELCVGGPGVALGYLDRPDLTAERFLPDPWGDGAGDRLYRTGDLGRTWADGRIELLGRSDDQVKVRGHRVELGEVEAALARQPGVLEAAVVAEREPGADLARLAAFVVAAGGAPAAGDLRKQLLAELPEPMVPSRIEVVEALPRLPNGKVDRQALSARVPQRNGLSHDAPPDGPTETLLARIWSEVLALPSVSVSDNFFELGGDSILILRIVARARQAGLELRPMQVFQHQTIAQLAAALSLPAPRAVEEEEVGPVPLTPIQSWFLEGDPVEPQHANMTLTLELDGPVERAALERALDDLVQRHGALRLRFERAAAGWRQSLAARGPAVRLEPLDVSGWPAPERELALEKLGDRLQTGLDLARGPLVRGALVERSPDPPLLVLVFHHLAVDAVSLHVLVEDLDAACRRALGRRTPPASAGSSFAAWSRRLASHAGSPALLLEQPFWLAQRGATALPLDFPDGLSSNHEASARTVPAWLEPATTRALLQDLPRALHVQAHEAILSAVASATAAWSGEPRILVEMEGHGREDLFGDLDLTRTVGWFTSLHPLALDLSPSDPVATLHAVRDRVRAVPARGVGFGVLRYLCPDPRVRAALEALPRPAINYNYLGQLDGRLGEGNVVSPLWLRAGAERSPRSLRRHVLEVVGQVHGGRLRLDWVYSENLHRRATVEALAQRATSTLDALVVAARAVARPPSGVIASPVLPASTRSDQDPA